MNLYSNSVADPKIFPTSLVVLQPSTFCNLDCTYCYLPDRHIEKRMTIDTIRSIVDRLLEWNNFAPTLDISWHSGEPLVSGLEFYKEAIPLFEPLSGRTRLVRHTVQTNCTLLTEEFCRFFHDKNISVGISIDGPKWLNDMSRKRRNGTGSFDKTLSGIQMLRNHLVHYYAIMVATESSFDHANEIYDFMEAIGVTFLGINIEEIEGVNKCSSLSEGTDEKYKAFLNTMFRRNLDGGSVVIRELYMTASYLRLAALPMRSASACLGEVLNFDYLGNVTSLSPELVSMPFGSNTSDLPIRRAFERPEWRKLISEVAEGIELCEMSCPYFSVCGGGNPSNKLGEHGTFACADTMACRYQVKLVTDLTLDLLEDNKTRPAIERLISNRHLMTM